MSGSPVLNFFAGGTLLVPVTSTITGFTQIVGPATGTFKVVTGTGSVGLTFGRYSMAGGTLSITGFLTSFTIERPNGATPFTGVISANTSVAFSLGSVAVIPPSSNLQITGAPGSTLVGDLRTSGCTLTLTNIQINTGFLFGGSSTLLVFSGQSFWSVGSSAVSTLTGTISVAGVGSSLVFLGVASLTIPSSLSFGTPAGQIVVNTIPTVNFGTTLMGPNARLNTTGDVTMTSGSTLNGQIYTKAAVALSLTGTIAGDMRIDGFPYVNVICLSVCVGCARRSIARVPSFIVRFSSPALCVCDGSGTTLTGNMGNGAGRDIIISNLAFSSTFTVASVDFTVYSNAATVFNGGGSFASCTFSTCQQSTASGDSENLSLSVRVCFADIQSGNLLAQGTGTVTLPGLNWNAAVMTVTGVSVSLSSTVMQTTSVITVTSGSSPTITLGGTAIRGGVVVNAGPTAVNIDFDSPLTGAFYVDAASTASSTTLYGDLSGSSGAGLTTDNVRFGATFGISGVPATTVNGRTTIVFGSSVPDVGKLMRSC